MTIGDQREQEILARHLAPANDLESAIVADLAPGSYTAIVSGVGRGTGIALVEIYDLEPSNGKLANISTRARVDVGDDVMIGGFIINGPQSQKNVIRALGPSLTAQGVTGALVNPVLDLYNSNGDLLIENDDYYTRRVYSVIGGYGLLPGSLYEPAIYFEGAPGSYTAIVSGIDGTADCRRSKSTMLIEPRWAGIATRHRRETTPGQSRSDPTVAGARIAGQRRQRSQRPYGEKRHKRIAPSDKVRHLTAFCGATPSPPRRAGR
jgi:hypothetical protein